MAVKKIFIDSPDLLVPRLATIPNDGLDYEITFAGGIFPMPGTNVTLNHSAGGKIVLLPHAGNAVYFNGGSSFPSFSIVGRDVSVHGMYFGITTPYYTPTLAGLGHIAFSIGGRDLDTGNYLCDPTNLVITDCTTNGFSAALAFGSSSSSIYTDIRILDCHTIDTARNSSFLITASSTALYTNAIIDNLRGNGKNGPDSLTADPINGVAQSSHSNGTSGWEVDNLNGASTVLVTRNIHLSQIFGSLNHDMHCFRIGGLNSPNVRITLRDCQWTGRYESGKALGDGGGLMWLGYYHTGGPTYLTSAPRPRVDIENCTFDSTILAAVTESPVALGASGPCSFNAQSDADYHFWDSHLSWHVPAAFSPYTIGTLFGSANAQIWHHNTSIVATSATNTPTGAQLLTIDASTRDNPGAIHGRIPTPS